MFLTSNRMRINHDKRSRLENTEKPIGAAEIRELMLRCQRTAMHTAHKEGRRNVQSQVVLASKLVLKFNRRCYIVLSNA